MSKKVVKVPVERIKNLIYHIRGQKVMLDRDLSELYGVETRALKQAVRRNITRFPEDFMFEMTKEEFENWRSQFVTSKGDKMGLRHRPMAFSEQGVAMLASVLKSERAVQVNIEIMRTFVKLRQILSAHKDLERKLKALEKRYDEQFKVVFDAIRALMTEEETPRKKIGFEVKEPRAKYKKKK
ncbi:ORF6N domain-containing protein [Thermodesulfobacteriota bacterium]